LRGLRRRWVLIAIAVPLIAALVVAIVFYARRPVVQAVVAAKPEAPPDLEKLRDSFVAGVNAVQAKDG